LALPWPGRKASSAGTSSAFNVVGAIHLAREIGEGQTVVTVAPDTGLKHLTGDLFHHVRHLDVP